MVKGTQFSVSVDQAGVAVEVFRGLVGVRNSSAELLHEILVRPGATAVGGGGRPFVLRFVESRDPWGSWGSDGVAPPVPARLIESAEDGTLQGARDAATAAVERALPVELVAELGDPEGTPEDLEEEFGDVTSGESEAESGELGATGSDGVPEDALDDVEEYYLEAALDPSGLLDIQRITSGGPNYILVTGSGLNEQLFESDLKDVEDGDFSSLSPTLMSYLSTGGIAPEDFAEMLLDLN
jgi:hypothetical protein